MKLANWIIPAAVIVVTASCTHLRAQSSEGHTPYADNFAIGAPGGRHTYTVPQGSRLVIEFISAEGCAASPADTRLQILIERGTLVTQSIFLANTSVAVRKCVDVNQPVRIYVDAGLTVITSANWSVAGGGSNWAVSISGHLEAVH